MRRVDGTSDARFREWLPVDRQLAADSSTDRWVNINSCPDRFPAFSLNNAIFMASAVLHAAVRVVQVGGANTQSSRLLNWTARSVAWN